MRAVRLLESLAAKEGGRSSGPSSFLAAREEGLARPGAAALRPASGQLFGVKAFDA